MDTSNAANGKAAAKKEESSEEESEEEEDDDEVSQLFFALDRNRAFFSLNSGAPKIGLAHRCLCQSSLHLFDVSCRAGTERGED